jgi:hypothetical protein
MLSVFRRSHRTATNWTLWTSKFEMFSGQGIESTWCAYNALQMNSAWCSGVCKRRGRVLHNWSRPLALKEDMQINLRLWQWTIFFSRKRLCNFISSWNVNYSKAATLKTWKSLTVLNRSLLHLNTKHCDLQSKQRFQFHFNLFISPIKHTQYTKKVHSYTIT